MGDGDDSKKTLTTTEMDTLCLDISSNRSSRDLLQRFMGSGSSSGNETVKEKDDDIELNLGLSLGGRFGVDKSPTKLLRSSSVAECLPAVRDDSDVVAPPPASYTGLLRTSSLPAETEERKRKQLQSFRRMEAKRRRSEKQRNSRGDKEGAASRGGGGNLTVEEKREIEVNFRERLERDKSLALARRPVRLSSWVAAANDQSISSTTDEAMAQRTGRQKATEGSSSGTPPSDRKTIGGVNVHSGSNSGERNNQDIDSSGFDVVRTQGREIGTNAVEDMPCVFTKGEGPHGRRADGILYKYGKGEEVRIMCVCHGTFFSPAEFVQHAGGTDVDNPLKHIVVNPNSSSLL